MSAAGPNAPLALAAWVALAACGQDDPSPTEVREKVAAERREGQREVSAARVNAEREFARVRGRSDGGRSADSHWIHSGPSGATYSRDPAVLRHTEAQGALDVQLEQAEAAYEVERSACAAHRIEPREACVRNAEREHDRRVERARSRFRRATMQENAMP